MTTMTTTMKRITNRANTIRQEMESGEHDSG